MKKYCRGCGSNLRWIDVKWSDNQECLVPGIEIEYDEDTGKKIKRQGQICSRLTSFKKVLCFTLADDKDHTEFEKDRFVAV